MTSVIFCSRIICNELNSGSRFNNSYIDAKIMFTFYNTYDIIYVTKGVGGQGCWENGWTDVATFDLLPDLKN